MLSNPKHPNDRPVEDEFSSTCFVALEFNGNLFEVLVDTKQTDNITNAMLFHTKICLDHLMPALHQIKPDDCVLDLGSHVGSFSLPCASLGATVVAVDASPRNFALLSKSRERNHFDNMIVVNTVVGRFAGEVDFLEDGPYGRVLLATEVGNTLRLPVQSVEQIMAQAQMSKIDVLKVDVEGYEMEVLFGMERVFESGRPRVVLAESHGPLLRRFGFDGHDLTRFLVERGYHVYSLMADGPMRIDESSLQLQSVVDILATTTPLEDDESRALTGVQLYPDALELSWLVSTLVTHFNSVERAHIGAELKYAPGEFLDKPRVRAALRMLKQDRIEDVRASVDWFTEQGPLSTHA